MEITGSPEQWWSRTLDHELANIRVHAIPAPDDATDFERRLGLTMAEPGSPEVVVERVMDLGRELGYAATSSTEGGTEPLWVVTLRK